MENFLSFYESGWIAAIIASIVPFLYIIGAYSAYHAIMHSRTAQGSTAWVVTLLTIPLFAVPFYWTFGRVKYYNYKERADEFNHEFENIYGNKPKNINSDYAKDKSCIEDARDKTELIALEKLSGTCFTSGNQIDLLINGQSTFDKILGSIDQADDYILVQYYILRDDDIGTDLKNALLNALNRKTKVMLLYDVVGSLALSDDYIEELVEAGADVSRFSGSDRGWFNRLRLNFRNHRKIIVIDGKIGFTGGLNVGDEYLGRSDEFGYWRDTHLILSGPVVRSLQLTFLRDWYFSLKEIPKLSWSPEKHETGKCALISATGPSDAIETCGLLFAHCIETAQKKVWIASPYFIPDDRVLAALQLAAIRGVDVRIMTPRKTDNVLFKYAHYAYFDDIDAVGAKIYLYEKGFAHQKIMLIDDKYSVIGTANMDNRSFRLNFEVNTVVAGKDFCLSTEEMLNKDFANSSLLSHEELSSKSWFFRLATRTTRLLAPIL